MQNSFMPFALFSLVLLSCHPARSQVKLVEDFLSAQGDSLTSLGWSTNQSTITNAVLVATPGLLYPKHPGSGMGNSARLSASGQDVYREFEPATDGTVYVFLMLRVESASSGDYVLHLQPSPQSTSYFSRLFIRQAMNGYLAFGIAKRGTNASPTHVYSDSLYSVDLTYCLALKYEFRDGSNTDDQASLYIFSGAPLPALEPLVPNVGPVTDATNDATTLSAVTLRQGDASRSATLLIDGLRICTAWDACLPVSIQSFVAVAVPALRVRLSWTTATEINCYGFTVQRAKESMELLEDIPGAFLEGQGTRLTPHSYTYEDTVPSSGIWYYRLRQSDLDGSSLFSETIMVEIPTSIRHEPSRSFHIDQNYPNPFNSETVIHLSLLLRTHVSVAIFNALGMEMRHLVDDILGPGEYAFGLDANDWPGGVYFCRIRAGGLQKITRMVLMR